VTPAELEARLVAQDLTPSSWSNEPGDTYAAHQHAYDKVLVAARGSITFHLVDQGRDVNLDVTLSEGERLDLPAGTVHAATVGPDGVTCLEAHLGAGTLKGPPRHRAAADW
jgi:quercetin dioxygenase-like cupin family protein